MQAPTSQNPASGNFAASTADTVTTSATTFVAPVYGQIDVSGSIDQVTLQQVTVTMNYDDKYAITLDASGSKALLESFDLSGNGPTFSVGWATGAKDKFEEVLVKVINEAVGDATDIGTGGIAGLSLKAGIEKTLRDTFRTVYSNNLPNLLENNWSATANVDAAGGAADMKSKLTAAAREVIAQQIPRENYVLYADVSENATIRALPLKNGDTLVFIFNVSAAASTDLTLNSGSTKTSGANADTGASNAGAVGGNLPYGPLVQNISYTFVQRKVAFFVTVSDGGNNGEALAGLE